MSGPRYYGFTRFSVHLPGSRGWNVSRQGGSGYAETLFNDARMQLRTDIFLTLAVPIYQSWAERFAYRHVVHFSSDLPDKWRERLDDAALRYPCLILDEVTDQLRENSLIAADVIEHGGADLVVRIRVDDDDILAADYLDALDRYVTRANMGFAVSFGAGIGAIYRNGRHTEFRAKREILPSAGQAYIGRFDRASQSVRGLKIGAHNRIDTIRPVIFDSREPMYLQTYHDQQDKELDRSEDPLARLERYPHFHDESLLAAKFPTLPR